jgi:hypothetical protein
MAGTQGTDARRFKIKADAFYVRHDDGVWLRNNIGSFSIRGAGSYQLIASLFASLDGRRSVGQICADLPGPARQSVSRLVDTLERNGFVKQVHHEAEEPPAWMRERYPTHLAFLDHHGDRPVSRLHSAREQLVACVGAGVALRAAVGALAEFGIARLAILTPDGTQDAIADLVSRAVSGDAGFQWRTVGLGAVLDLNQVADRPEVHSAAQVVVAVDDQDPVAVADFQTRLRDRGQSVGVLGRCGDFVVAMPCGAAERCWECVWRSVAAPVTGNAAGLPPAVTPATIGALHVVQQAFARLADVHLDGGDAVTSVEPLVPAVRTHTVHRHPLCDRHRRASVAPVAPADEPVRPDLPFSEDPADLVAVSDRIVTVTAAWTDRVVGPLLSVGEGSVDQLPLAGSTCLVPDPAATADARSDLRLLCRAVSPREARNQVVLFALERLVQRTAELRGAPDRTVYGVGWSTAEAAYRAGLAVARALPGTARLWRPAGCPSTAGRVLRSFLTGTLAADHRHWRETAVEQLSTGFVRAHLRTADGAIASGVGIDEDHAIDQALLQAVARGRPDDGKQVVAHLAPPVATWTEALATVDRNGHRMTPGGTDAHPGQDVGALLPFLDGHAQVVAVTLPGDAT